VMGVGLRIIWLGIYIRWPSGVRENLQIIYNFLLVRPGGYEPGFDLDF
jgi:hypothetical protein